MDDISTASSFRQVPTSCFKAYDNRGHVPDELNEDVTCRIGRALTANVLEQHVSKFELLLQGDR